MNNPAAEKATCVHFLLNAKGEVCEAGELPWDAISLGGGVFETVLVLAGRPVFRQRHLARLTKSCEELLIASRRQVEAMCDAAWRAAATAHLARARMRIAVFGGGTAAEPAAVVSLRPAAAPSRGMKLLSSDVTRCANDVLARHKTVCYLANVLAATAARKRGYDDALIFDSAGNIAETSTANLFFFVGGGLVTPSLGCILPGVVRAWVIENAACVGLPVEEREIPRTALGDCRAAFVTNSIVGLCLVSQIDGTHLSSAAGIEQFQALLGAYDAAITAGE